MFQKMFRDFAAKEVAKVADQADKKEELPRKLLQRAAARVSWARWCPKSRTAAPAWISITFTLLLEALAAECASTALTIHVHNSLALRTILRHAAPTPRRRAWCPRWSPASASARSR